MSRTATRLFRKPQGERGKMRFYRLDPPLQDEELGPVEYVLVSAVIAPLSGPETYIFPADRDGNIVSWGELEGSYRGGLDHDAALARAGYEVSE